MRSVLAVLFSSCNETGIFLRRYAKNVSADLYGKLVQFSVAFPTGIVLYQVFKDSDQVRAAKDLLASVELWEKPVQNVSSNLSPPMLARDVLILQALSKSGPFAAETQLKDAEALMWGPSGIYGGIYERSK